MEQIEIIFTAVAAFTIPDILRYIGIISDEQLNRIFRNAEKYLHKFCFATSIACVLLFLIGAAFRIVAIDLLAYAIIFICFMFSFKVAKSESY